MADANANKRTIKIPLRDCSTHIAITNPSAGSIGMKPSKAVKAAKKNMVRGIAPYRNNMDSAPKSMLLISKEK
jgi:hypothetical protein